MNMSTVTEQDLVVVGGGPGGYAAAFLAADHGKQATIINDSDKIGGTCLLVGCIPSKALLHTARVITEAREAAKIGIEFSEPKIDVEGVRKHWNKVVQTLTTGLQGLCKRRGVKYIASRAKLLDGQTLELSDGSRHRFQHCILATGSTPVKPGPLQLDSPLVMTSSEALRLEGVPCSLLVVGGGYIGLELGWVYAALGCSVTVVEMMPGLLPGADRELVKPLAERLKKAFKAIHLSTQVLKLEAIDKGIRAHLKGEALGETTLDFDRVLVAVGRRPVSAGLGLENTKVQLDAKGFIQVDEHRRTAEERIYAVGDVVGEPMLAHKAHYEAKIAVESILGEPAVVDYRAMPAVVFTDPEVAWTGLTETEAKKQGRENEIEVLSYPWAASGRALTLGRTEGLTRIIVDKATEQVLGVGIVGVEAGEMIAEATLAIEMGATAKDFALTIHAHPTLSETLMQGAETLYGTATDIFKPRRKS
jgi:dihydrolipoamide dehydrogenase